VELIVTGSAKDVGVFPSVDARELLPHHAPQESAVATPNNEVGKFICVRASLFQWSMSLKGGSCFQWGMSLK
jgi:hypothetical protein